MGRERGGGGVEEELWVLCLVGAEQVFEKVKKW